MPNCVKCVTLVVELGTDAERMQELVGVIQVARVRHSGREPGCRADGRLDVEVERDRADR